MEVMEDNGEIVFLYQVKDGTADCSYALNVAKIAGIDEAIIKRAEEVSICDFVQLTFEHVNFSMFLLVFSQT